MTAPLMTARPSKRHRAFTLLELLVVIAIIAILTTLLIMGVRSVIKSGKEKATRTDMENLRNLITERQNHGGMQAIYALYPVQPPPPPPPGYPNGAPLPTPSVAGTAITVPVDMSLNGTDRTPSFKTVTPTIDPQNELARTVMVMSLLRSVPTNAKMLAQLPGDSFLPAPPATVQMPPNAPPIPVDGWGNPMIFVPGGGITVYVTGADNKPVATPNPIVAPDHKGFWVSGGPDGCIGGYFDHVAQTIKTAGAPVAGDTAYGDDNIYSFEN